MLFSRPMAQSFFTNANLDIINDTSFIICNTDFIIYRILQQILQKASILLHHKK